MGIMLKIMTIARNMDKLFFQMFVIIFTFLSCFSRLGNCPVQSLLQHYRVCRFLLCGFRACPTSLSPGGSKSAGALILSHPSRRLVRQFHWFWVIARFHGITAMRSDIAEGRI
jgi:hypothetical protein